MSTLNDDLQLNYFTLMEGYNDEQKLIKLNSNTVFEILLKSKSLLRLQ